MQPWVRHAPLPSRSPPWTSAAHLVVHKRVPSTHGLEAIQVVAVLDAAVARGAQPLQPAGILGSGRVQQGGREKWRGVGAGVSPTTPARAYQRCTAPRRRHRRRSALTSPSSSTAHGAQQLPQPPLLRPGGRARPGPRVGRASLCVPAPEMVAAGVREGSRSLEGVQTRQGLAIIGSKGFACRCCDVVARRGRGWVLVQYAGLDVDVDREIAIGGEGMWCVGLALGCNECVWGARRAGGG